jgi:TonB family protein
MPERVIYEVELHELESLYFPEGEIEFTEASDYFRQELRGNVVMPDSEHPVHLEGNITERPQDGWIRSGREAVFNSIAVSSFRLDQPEDKESGSSFDLGRDPEKVGLSKGSSLKRELKMPDLQYSRIIGLSSPGYSEPVGNRGAGGTIRRSGFPDAVADVDISSWADETVRKIQENWSIPSESSEKIKGSVGIYLVIRKKGDLVSAEIMESSGYSSLDQAAMKALDVSFPLPGLPDNFPAENLEIYLVFDYDV